MTTFNLGSHLAHPALQRLPRHAPALVTALLIVALAAAVARLTWDWLTPPATLPPPPPPARTAAAPAAPVADPAQRIAQRHLFGKATTAQPAVTTTPIDAPDTRLNFTLRGVYATDDENEGYALIASRGGREKLYRVGDKLPGNIRLSAVYPDRVILDRGGRFETLRLRSTRATGSVLRPPGLPRPGGDNRRLGPNSATARLRQEVLRNPAKLGQYVNAVPVRRNGRFVGFRIVTRQSHPALRELDLRSGDIITEVNGIRLDRPEKGFQVLQQLARAHSVSVTLERGGRVIHVNRSL